MNIMHGFSFVLAVSFVLGFGVEERDESYTKKILDYTTEPFFLTELVDYLPKSSQVPTPERILGRIIGAPNRLSYTSDVNRYMKALDESSSRVRVESMGKSEEGREMILVIISDEDNLEQLDDYKLKTRLLSDPRKLSDVDAEKIIETALPFYYATGGMHSPETGSPEMLMELAYRLAVSETEFIKTIRKNSIVLLTPILDTDGRDRYVDTYHYRKQFPNKPPIPLVYWGKYVAHDNNRDGMALSLALSKNLMKKWFEYHPQVMHDLHESIPFLYISTGTGPYNAWLDPITIDEWHLLAYHEVNEMTRRGVPGVWTHGFYDGWAPNYAFYAANGHNAIGRFYETYGGYGADTGIRTVGAQSQREWFRPNPPFPRVRWSLRNNINLMQSALLLGMHHVAKDKTKFLKNYWLKSKRSVAKARSEGPAAYVIHHNEPNRMQLRLLLEMLSRQGIEIHQLGVSTTVEGETFGKGSYVIRMDQPYSRMADMLLDTQYYNPTDPRPYDDTGWTLGPLFNVRTTRVKDVSILDAKMQEVTDIPAATALSSEWTSKVFAIRETSDIGPTLLISELKKREAIESWAVALQPFSAGEGRYQPGSWVVTLKSTPDAEVKQMASDFGVQIMALNQIPEVKMKKIDWPRVALVHSWTNTQDEGWFRIALDSLGLSYTYVSVHFIRDTENINEMFDVIVLPQMRGTAQSIVNGYPKVGEPIPWKPLEGFPHLGGPDISDDIRGGIEIEGILNLKRFVEKGGVLVCVGASCSIPIDYGLVTGISIERVSDWFAPGGVYRLYNPGQHPITYGYGEKLGVYFNANSLPLFTMGSSTGMFTSGIRPTGRGSLTDPDVIQGRPSYVPRSQTDDEIQTTSLPSLPRPRVILRFAASNEVLISGGLSNPDVLASRPAVVSCPLAQGNIVLFAINPMWRMQTQGSWQLLFNTFLYREILNHQDN